MKKPSTREKQYGIAVNRFVNPGEELTDLAEVKE